MNNVVALFLDRLAERLTGLMAGLVSSRVAGMHAAVQAEQQSELEDLARKYEAEGKSEIAETLRLRSLRLTSTNLASEAVDCFEQLASEPKRLTGPKVAPSHGELSGLPDFGTTPTKSRGRKLRKENSDPSPELPGDAS